MRRPSLRSVGRRAATAIAALGPTILVPAVFVAACGDDGATGPRPAPGLSAVLQQWREDEVRGVFMVSLRNDTDRAVRVSSLELAWPGFAESATSRPDYSVGPGVRVDLAVPEVQGRCTEPLRLDDTTPSADGATLVVNGDMAVRVTDPAGVLARLHERSCHDQYVEHATGIRLGDTWAGAEVDGGPVLRGSVEIHPAPGADVSVVSTDGSLMMSLETTGPPAPLPDGGAAVPVDVGRLGRCDAHALGEDKQAYRFEVSMTIDGVPVQATLMVPEALRPSMYAVVEARCGTA